MAGAWKGESLAGLCQTLHPQRETQTGCQRALSGNHSTGDEGRALTGGVGSRAGSGKQHRWRLTGVHRHIPRPWGSSECLPAPASLPHFVKRGCRSYLSVIVEIKWERPPAYRCSINTFCLLSALTENFNQRSADRNAHNSLWCPSLLFRFLNLPHR